MWLATQSATRLTHDALILETEAVRINDVVGRRSSAGDDLARRRASIGAAIAASRTDVAAEALASAAMLLGSARASLETLTATKDQLVQSATRVRSAGQSAEDRIWQSLVAFVLSLGLVGFGYVTGPRAKARQAIESAEREAAESALALDDAASERESLIESLEEASRELRSAQIDLSDLRKIHEVSARRFHALFSRLPSACFTANEFGRVMEWNLAAETVFGLTAPEVFDRSIWDAVLTEDPDQIAHRHVGAVFLGEQPAPISWTVRRPDGEVRETIWSVAPVLDPDQHIVGVVSTFHDVTEELAVQRQLNESIRLNDRILKSSPDLIYIFDLKALRNVMCSQNVLEVLGYTPAEIQKYGQRLVTEIIHADDRPRVAKHHQSFADAADGEVRVIDYRIRRSDGTYVWLSSSEVVFERDENGVPTKTVGIARDVTLQRETQSRLHVMAIAAGSSGQGVLIADDESNVIFVNQMAADLLRVPAAETTGKSLAELVLGESVAPTDRRALIQDLYKCRDLDLEFSRTGEDGTEQWLNLKGRFSPAEKERNALYLLVIDDISARKRAELSLQAAEERWTLALESAGCAVWDWRTDDSACYFSSRWHELLGIPSDFVWKSLRQLEEFLVPEDAKRLVQQIEDHVCGLKPAIDLVVETTSRGQARWIRLSGRCAPSEDEVHGRRIVGFAVDATAHETAERELAASEGRFRSVMETLHDGVVLQDVSGRVLLANLQAERMLGLSIDELLRLDDPHSIWRGRSLEGKPLADDQLPFRVVAETHGHVRNFFIRRPDPEGNDHVLELNCSPIRRTPTGDVRSVLTVFSDVTDRIRQQSLIMENVRKLSQAQVDLENRSRELEALNEHLRTVSVTDGLTGLLNHRQFQELLASDFSELKAKARPHSVLMLDVDHFKAYNDSHGHLAGDDVLRTVAEILVATAPLDAIIARYGGEEFGILLPGATAKAAEKVAESCRAAIAGYDWPLAGITISVGVATYAANMESSTDYLGLADRAMYAAKSRGRNRVVHARQLTGDVAA